MEAPCSIVSLSTFQECGQRRCAVEQQVKELKRELSAMEVEMKKCQVGAQVGEVAMCKQIRFYVRLWWTACI